MRGFRMLSVVCLTLTLVSAHAQGGDGGALVDLQGLIRDESIRTAVIWDLAFRYDAPEYRAGDPEFAANSLLTGVLPAGASEGERDYFLRFGTALSGVIRNLGFIGGSRAGFLSSDRYPPVKFFVHEGHSGVLISGIGVGMEFNTFNTRQLARAERVVLEHILPVVTRLELALREAGVGWVGVSITYGIRDFTDRYAVGDSETTIAIFPLDQVQLLTTFAITDAALVDSALVFNGRLSDIRRISIGR